MSPLRRRSDRERVRITQRNMSNLATDYAVEVVRLRRVMYQAVNQIDAGRPDVARATLAAKLRERWWS